MKANNTVGADTVRLRTLEQATNWKLTLLLDALDDALNPCRNDPIDDKDEENGGEDLFLAALESALRDDTRRRFNIHVVCRDGNPQMP